MSLQRLWVLSLTTTAEAEDPVVALFERVCQQAPSVFISQQTGRRKVTAFLNSRAVGLRCARQVAAELRNLKTLGLLTPAAVPRLRPIKAQDWAESWKRHFRVLTIDQRLVVKPSWSKVKARAGQVMITLDPGLAFGTGQHPTTSFCLEQLVKYRPQRCHRSFLDLGTGSGILALAAGKLGYAPVDAVDIDPVAVRVARANAVRNDVKVNLRCCDLLADRQTKRGLSRVSSAKRYDLVCANLVYDILLSARIQIVRALRPKGILVLAGILQGQFAEVLVAYRTAGMSLVCQRVEKEWSSCALTRGGT